MRKYLMILMLIVLFIGGCTPTIITPPPTPTSITKAATVTPTSELITPTKNAVVEPIPEQKPNTGPASYC